MTFLHPLSRFHKLYFLLFTFLFTVPGLIPDAAGADLQQLKNSPALKGGIWAVYARYCDSDSVLIDIQSDYLLAPASCQKILTTGLALHFLGPEFRYKTEIRLSGNRRGRDWKGDLTVIGSGDPSLGSRWSANSVTADDFYNEIVSSLGVLKINRISGDLIVDNRLFSDRRIPDGWVWQDIGNYYGTGMQPFCLGDNLYRLIFRPGEKAGEPAQVIGTEPELYNFKFINHMKTGPKGSGDNGYIYSAPGMNMAVLRGSVPAGTDSFTIMGADPDPALNMLEELKQRLAAAGITLTGTLRVLIPGEGPSVKPEKLLCTFQSPPLHEILMVTNRRSVNLYAEQLLRSAAVYGRGITEYEEALGLYRDFFDSLGVSSEGLGLVDGSGLSRTNKVSARMMGDFLAAMSGHPDFSCWYGGFSVAGVRDELGFMSSFGRDSPAAGNARVKSGYIQDVRSHSGYVRDSRGRLIAFSCIANNYSGGTSEITALNEQVLIFLAGQ